MHYVADLILIFANSVDRDKTPGVRLMCSSETLSSLCQTLQLYSTFRDEHFASNLELMVIHLTLLLVFHDQLTTRW